MEKEGKLYLIDKTWDTKKQRLYFVHGSTTLMFNSLPDVIIYIRNRYF